MAAPVGNTGVIAPPPNWIVDSEDFTVRSITLDSLVGQLPRVDLVKIDVEGAESLVVAGMSEFVAHYRPTVVFEWAPIQIADAGFTPVELAASVGAWDMDIATLGPVGKPRRSTSPSSSSSRTRTSCSPREAPGSVLGCSMARSYGGQAVQEQQASPSDNGCSDGRW